MSKFLYPIYKLNIESYKKWWLYHKKAGGSGILSEILQGFSFNLENTLNRKFKLFEIEGNSVQDGTPSPDNEVPIYSAGDGSITEKIVNKNLLDKENIKWYRNNTDWGTFDAQTNRIKCEAFKIQGGKTYTLSGIPSGMTFISVRTYTEWNGVNTSDVTIRGNTFTLGNDVKYIHLLLGGENFTDETKTLLKNSNIMLEPGSTATPYVPHEEQDYSIEVQQPMRSIGDVRDCFVKKSDGWYERHYISKVVLDGTEPWSLQNDCFTFNISDIKPTPNYADRNQLITISNYYIAQTSEYRSQMLDLRVCKTIDGGTPKQIAIKDTSKTLAEFKAELAQKYANGKPVYVYYLLAEPLDLPCTEEQVEQLENKPSTYKDFTIIQSEDETEAHLKIQYYKEG